MNISMKLVCQYVAFFFNFSLNSSHLHLLQVENCDSNSRLVVDVDDNCKVRLQRVNCLSNKKIEREVSINPLNSHDASKQNFLYLKNNLISYT